MNKDKSIINFLELVNNKFGHGALFMVDHWNICDAVGLQKNNKLIYIEYLKFNHFFYECELLVNDPEVIYIAKDSENNVSEERLLEVIEKFFGIKRLSVQ